jgi:hypothetical protein
VGEAQLAAGGEPDPQRLLAALAELARELAEPLWTEAELARRQQAARWLRRLGPLALGGALGWVLLALFTRENLALHTVVSVSSSEPKVRAHPASSWMETARTWLSIPRGPRQHALSDLGGVRQISRVGTCITGSTVARAAPCRC